MTESEPLEVDDQEIAQRRGLVEREEMARDRWIAGAALIVLAGSSLLPPWTPGAVRLAPALVAVVLVAYAWRRPSAAGGMAMVVAMLVLLSGISPLLWQLNMGAALGALALASRWRPELGAPMLQLGRLAIGSALACALVTPVALVGWVVLMRPDVSNVVSAIPDASLAVLLVGGLAFAVVNALLEEWIWRGVFQPRLTRLFTPAMAILLQAVSFGVAHAWGFPRGLVGVLLVAVWGTMLGWLRHHTHGLLAVVLAHIVADATIAALVLFWLR